jgi:hypothetical protein
MLHEPRLFAAALMLIGATGALAQPSFELLGNPLGSSTAFWSQASGVSGDGTVVYGVALEELVDPLRPETGVNRATFAWRNGYPVQLSRASGGADQAFGASRNGRFIGGRAPQGAFGATVWGPGQPRLSLSGINSLPTQDAVGISDDGTRVIGGLPYGSGSQDGAYSWSASSGYTIIPPIAGFRSGPEQGPGHIILGSAGDARIALGYETRYFVDAFGRFDYSAQAFYWTAATGTVAMGWASQNAVSPTSFAADATPDGSVICGASNTSGSIGRIGHIWTAAGGWERIVPGDQSSPALSISEDGQTVVGWYSGSETTPARAYIWTRADGFNDLQNLLEAQGAVIPNGFSLSEARGVSDDGQTIVGTGVDLEGRSIGWVARLNPTTGCPTVVTPPAATSTTAGEDVVLEAVFRNGVPASTRWFRNGVEVSDGVGGASIGGGLVFGSKTTRLTIERAQSSDAGSYRCEVVGDCGTVTSVPAALSVAASVNCAVQIDGMRSASATSGESFSLSALVVGSGPLTYRWFRNGVRVADGPAGAAPGGGTVSGSSTPNLVVTTSSTADSGTYWCEVTGPCGTVSSGGATVLVSAGAGCPVVPRIPDIIGTPTPGGFLQIGIGSLLGNGPFTFAWTRNGQPVSSGPGGASQGGGQVFVLGEPLNKLIISGVQPSDSGVYVCTISNACGSTTTLPLRVQIGTPVTGCSLADIAGGGGDGREPDGVVDGTDFIAFINAFGIGDATVDGLADVAGGADTTLPEGGPDGTIDGTDFIAFINAFGAGC